MGIFGYCGRGMSQAIYREAECEMIAITHKFRLYLS